MRFWKIPIIFGILSVACREALGLDLWCAKHFILLAFLTLFFALGAFGAEIARKP
jgi:hypothetical protein